VLRQQSQLVRQGQQLTVQSRELGASCSFWYVLGTLPVTIPPGEKRPGQALVALVADSRNSYLGQRCGTLPAPSGALVHWAGYYKVPVDSSRS
jgi:hypothetical protein